MERRRFLKIMAAGALGLAIPGCSDKLENLFGPEKEGLWGLNVHPYGGTQADLQIKALQELGIRKIRITMGLDRDLAGYYMRSYPAEYVGLVTDFELGAVNRRRWPGMVRDVVSRSSGVSYLEILNEPQAFLNLSPQNYVTNYLMPAYEIIKERRPDIKVVAAAPRGTSDGSIYFHEMSDAGADSYCDFRGVHLYNNDAEVYLFGTDRPFMVTETGTSNRAGHLQWWKDNMPHFSRVLDTSNIYYYVLMDNPETGHNLISTDPDSEGRVVPVSPLYDYIREKY